MKTKDILKKLREEKGLTIKEVATGTGMQYTMCREYESGDRKLGMSAAIKNESVEKGVMIPWN